MSDHSEAESFSSAQEENEAHRTKISDRFSPKEEATHKKVSNDSKTLGNEFFARAAFSDALSCYEKALASLPSYVHYETAVIRSNIAACYLKTEDWKAAVDAATSSLEQLERLVAAPKRQTEKGDKDLKDRMPEKPDSTALKKEDEDGKHVAAHVSRDEALAESGKTMSEVQKIRIKALLRRARARTEIGGWANLQGAEEDYQELSSLPELSSMDHQSVAKASRTLPQQLEVAKQKEMGEMMGKLKDLGNGILKPFGLSTNNFQFTKDQSSGGYSMQFNQGQS